MPRAWLLAVVSSDKQAETLPHQRAWAKEVAAANGWTLEREEDFEDVSSGKRGPRRLVMRLLAEIESTPAGERPAWLLMLRLDRIGRGSIVESQVVVHKLKQLGVRVWTRDQGEIKNDSAMDELMVAIASTVARMENDVKREKSTNAHRRIQREGKHYGHAPYGTILVERKPVPYEPEAAIVRGLFERRLQGWGVHRLSRWAASCAPPKRRANGAFREIKWARGTVEGMLECATYRGSVVPPEVFDAVQALRKPATRRPTRYPWPLRGAVRCTCGYLLTGGVGGTSTRRRYYYCQNIAVHDGYPMHRADSLEAQFIAKIADLTADQELLDQAGSDEDAQPFEDRARALESQRESLTRKKTTLWEMAEAGNLSPKHLGERLTSLDAEIDGLEERIAKAREQSQRIRAAAQVAASAREALASIAEVWPDAPMEDRQDMAQAVAEAFEGFWAAPPEKGKAAHSVLKTGIELRFDYGENCTQMSTQANRKFLARLRR